jgi:hypothetical protein
VTQSYIWISQCGKTRNMNKRQHDFSKGNNSIVTDPNYTEVNEIPRIQKNDNKKVQQTQRGYKWTAERNN